MEIEQPWWMMKEENRMSSSHIKLRWQIKWTIANLTASSLLPSFLSSCSSFWLPYLTAESSLLPSFLNSCSSFWLPYLTAESSLLPSFLSSCSSFWLPLAALFRDNRGLLADPKAAVYSRIQYKILQWDTMIRTFLTPAPFKSHLEVSRWHWEGAGDKFICWLTF